MSTLDVCHAEGVVTWGLVVPVKALAVAKSRLGSTDHAWRQDLALAFAVDVVTAGLACALISRVVVVTDDERAATELGNCGARVVGDEPRVGLNAALTFGEQVVRAHEPSIGVVAVAADLPALRPDHLLALLPQVLSRGFVADAAGTGTTVLAAAPGWRLLPAFGPQSRERHIASGALELDAPAALRRDVDTAADLDAAQLLGLGARTLETLRARGSR
ncbi:MAG TPA: 2-phospho-L-lactate guanylyltransferase [Mycobacteriales bacterium]|nr:2-phospho-L-lactate guanylyltransferase [Mycobacteriales bacterium]